MTPVCLLDSFDRLKDRKPLFQAWGILFEEYVNWFLRDRKYRHPHDILGSSKVTDGSEVLMGPLCKTPDSCLWNTRAKC